MTKFLLFFPFSVSILTFLLVWGIIEIYYLLPVFRTAIYKKYSSKEEKISVISLEESKINQVILNPDFLMKYPHFFDFTLFQNLKFEKSLEAEIIDFKKFDISTLNIFTEYYRNLILFSPNDINNPVTLWKILYYKPLQKDLFFSPFKYFIKCINFIKDLIFVEEKEDLTAQFMAIRVAQAKQRLREYTKKRYKVVD